MNCGYLRVVLYIDIPLVIFYIKKKNLKLLTIISFLFSPIEFNVDCNVCSINLCAVLISWITPKQNKIHCYYYIICSGRTYTFNTMIVWHSTFKLYFKGYEYWIIMKFCKGNFNLFLQVLVLKWH